MPDSLHLAQDLLAAGRVDDAVATAAAAGTRGDAAAWMQLAVWHLAGTSVARDLPAARQYLRHAVEIGHVDAALMEIALTANGTGAPADWGHALTLLRQAAAADPVAALHLSLIDQMRLDDAGMPAELPAPERLCDAPEMLRYRRLLTPAECEHLARVGAERLEPGLVTDPRTGKQIADPIRTSFAAVVGPTSEDLVVQALNRRIAMASSTAPEQGEPLQILRYAPGQQYRLHSDALPRVSNQRIKTALAYLNQGFSGGETSFPELNITIEPGGGDLLVFSNVQADGEPDWRARHAGLPVVQGVKWLATRWIRAAPYDAWNPA